MNYNNFVRGLLIILSTTILISLTVFWLLVNKAEALTAWVNPMVQYESIELNYYGQDVTKIYDHEEQIICYVYRFSSISCVKD